MFELDEDRGHVVKANAITSVSVFGQVVQEHLIQDLLDGVC